MPVILEVPQMSDEEIERDLDQRFHAHMILAEKKDDLWDLCQKFIDRQQVVNEEAAYMTAEVGTGRQNTEFLIAVGRLVGYYRPEVLEPEYL